MSFKANPLSFLGRMSYTGHLLFYPSAGLFYLFVIKPYMEKKNQKQEQAEWDSMPKLKKVDPDLFNPFSPIPYHNSPEVKYVFANVKMHNYINENHINPDTYVWKDFHNSYDHDHKNAYLYNWTSIHGPRDH